MFKSRTHTINIQQFYELLCEKRDQKFIMQNIFDLLDFEYKEHTQRIALEILFKNPVTTTFYNIQYIEIIIKPVEEDFIELEKLLQKENHIKAIPLLEKYNDYMPETLAFAYVQKGEYEKGIELSKKLVNTDFGSIAHFTIGLAYFGRNEYEKSFKAYQLGIHACTYDWHPKPKENLEKFISENQIEQNHETEKILKLLNRRRRPLKAKDRCYCDSGKYFKNCHGK